jgi:hypothetical protein
MRGIALGALFWLSTMPTPSLAQVPEATSDELFLSVDDLQRAVVVAPQLKEATLKGKVRTQSFLATQERDFRKTSMTLHNIAIAYTAVKFDEWVAQLEPLLDKKAPNSQYRQLIEDGRKQLATISSAHSKATKNGRTALEVNKEIVSKNLAAVEEIMMHVRGVQGDSLPK